LAPVFGNSWLGMVWDLLVKSSGTLLIAILLAGLMRRQSASLRHLALSLFLIGLVFLPLFSVLPSGWEMRWLPPWLEAQGQSPESAAADVKGNILQGGLSGLASLTTADRGFNEAGKDLLSSDPDGPHRGPALGAGLMVLWLAGLGFLLLRLALGIATALRLTREGERLKDAAWQKLLRRFISLVSLRREVDLKSHHRVVVPLTWGFLRPVVIMPADADSWTEEERTSALFHELSHVKRKDFLILLLVRLSLALYWVNPLTWVVFRMLKKEQEKACDEMVLQAGVRPSTYAANLLSFKVAACRAGAPAAAFLGVLGMFGRSQLNDRLASILKQKFAFQEVQMKTKIMICVVSFLAVALIGLARPSGGPASYETEAVALEPLTGAVESLSPGTPVQETREAQEEKQKKQTGKAEQEKRPQEKAKEKITLGVEVPKEGEDLIEITVIEGDTKKIIRVDKPVIKVIKDEAGKKIVVLSGEKEVLAIEGDDVQLKVKGDKAFTLKSAEPLKLEKGLLIKSTSTDELDERTIILEGKPHFEIVKTVDIPALTTIHFKNKEGKVETKVIAPKAKGAHGFYLKPVPVEPHVHMEPPVTPQPPVAPEPPVAVEPRIAGVPPAAPKPPVKVAPKIAVEPPVAAAPRVAVEPDVVAEPHVLVEPHIHEPEVLIGTIHQEELQKKIAETQALLNKIEVEGLEEAKLEAQKETLRELKEALEDLKKELDKEKEGLRAIQVQVAKPEKSYSVVLAKPEVIVDGKVGLLAEGKDNIVTMIDDKGTCTVVFTGKLREGQSEAYEKALDKLKKGLPEGYEVESEVRGESGAIVIKIKGHDNNKESREAVISLVKQLKEELKK
jgi:beta-lactamase regulating signal transducer with metallopeptidase domain